jgi:hypothetical protein
VLSGIVGQFLTRIIGCAVKRRWSTAGVYPSWIRRIGSHSGETADPDIVLSWILFHGFFTTYLLGFPTSACGFDSGVCDIRMSFGVFITK